MGSVFSSTIGITTQLFHVRDEKTTGVQGGTFTSGAWFARDLNTIVLNEIPGASLSANQMTLPAGTYHIEASAPAYFVDNHQAKLWDVTNTVDIIIGTSETTVGSTSNVTNKSFVTGKFVLSATTVVEFRHKCFTTHVTNGFGVQSNSGSTETYSEIKLWREIPAQNDGNGTLVKGPLLHVRDQKASNINGGTFTAGAWQTRTLNTILSGEIVGASLSSNQITLPAGSYYMEAIVPAFAVSQHGAKLRDITNALDMLIGSAVYGSRFEGSFGPSTDESFIQGKFTTSGITVFELQHKCIVTVANTGFGLASGVTDAVYSDIRIWKLVRAGPSIESSDNDQVSFKNAIINGDMRQAQRGTSFVSPVNGTYTLDRWEYAVLGTAVHTITQDTTVVPNSQFRASMKFDCTTADAAVAATDFVFITQKIEGFNFQKFDGKSATFSMWIRAGKTGTMCVSFRSAGNDRSYVSEITIDAADTWERKTVSVNFDSDSVGGTWDFTSGVGLFVGIALSSGTAFQTTADSWQSGNFIATANQDNFVDATGTTTDVYMTGIQLEENSTVTDFEHLHYGVELALCQRYYQIGSYSEQLPIANGTVVANYRTPVYFAVAMRTIPTVAGTNGQGTFQAANISNNSCSIGRSNTVATRTNTGTYTADAEL